MYGVSINFIEVFYKNAYYTFLGSIESVKYGDGDKLLAWTGMFSLSTGVVVMLLLTFIGGRAIKILGWTITALITPSVLMLFGVPFMFFCLINYYKEGFIGSKILIVMGFLAVLLSKAFKYSFFDPTKEMAYIPLDDDLKSKGKAAVDVVGARFGKSGSGLIQIILIFAKNSEKVDEYISILAPLLLVSIMSWFFAAINLGRRFKKLTEKPKETVAMA